MSENTAYRISGKLLYDTASAIRSKKEIGNPIPVSTYAAQIASIDGSDPLIGWRADTPWLQQDSIQIGTIAQALDTPCYKLNPHYAVSCIAKYTNGNNETVYTPVLISAEQNAVQLSHDGTTPITGNITTHTIGSLTFYMNTDETTAEITASSGVQFLELTSSIGNANQLFAIVAERSGIATINMQQS